MSILNERLRQALANRYQIVRELGAGGMLADLLVATLAPVSTWVQTPPTCEIPFLQSGKPNVPDHDVAASIFHPSRGRASESLTFSSRRQAMVRPSR